MSFSDSQLTPLSKTGVLPPLSEFNYVLDDEM